MGRPQLYTKNGHLMFDMVALYQKAIRRGDARMAGYAANELRGRYHEYLWKRTLVISAEDCYGIITKEIIALKQADEIYNKGRKEYDREPLFISKAVTLLLQARKNRDADFFNCNCMESEKTISAVDLKEYLDIEDCTFDKMPEYTYDCKTVEGRRRGKNLHDFVKAEQEALTPHQPGLFDEESWSRFFELQKVPGGMNQEKGFPKPTPKEVLETERDDFDDEIHYEQESLFGK